jgi:hypothetical protein
VEVKMLLSKDVLGKKWSLSRRWFCREDVVEKMVLLQDGVVERWCCREDVVVEKMFLSRSGR